MIPLMQPRTVCIVVILVVATIFLAGCLPGGATYAQQPAGFFSGVWHGWIAPLSLIVAFFEPSIRVYERNNTGWWYDFGFYMAIISGFGGLSLFRRRPQESSPTKAE